MAELWTTTSQSEVGGTQAGDTHSVLLCTRKGSSPEMAGSGELLLPLSMATTCASKRDANTPMTTNHRKTILHVRLSWHKSQADNKAKMNDWDRPNRAVPMGRLKFEKKRKLGPTDRQSGSVQTMTLPRHADKDCLTTEENLTITSSRITRQGRCRCGAAASSLVTRNHQPTKKGCVLKEPLETREYLHAGIFGQT